MKCCQTLLSISTCRRYITVSIKMVMKDEVLVPAVKFSGSMQVMEFKAEAFICPLLFVHFSAQPVPFQTLNPVTLVTSVT